MDVVLDYLFPGSGVTSQGVQLFFLLTTGGYILYFLTAGLSYIFLFDKRLEKHPLFLKGQIKREIFTACASLPFMSILTVPFFLLEVRGYSKLHSDFNLFTDLLVGVVSFILFTDCLIYWIHRGLHYKALYARLHKTHHLWKVPTPFASHAFHPLDGFLQSLPYHIYVFIFPMNKYLYLSMFLFVNMWTVSIHDGYFSVPQKLRVLINGAAHHSDHHLYYNYNYGQFFTLWDRIGKSFREPGIYFNKSI